MGHGTMSYFYHDMYASWMWTAFPNQACWRAPMAPACVRNSHETNSLHFLIWWGVSHLSQAKLCNCIQILCRVAVENYIAIPESKTFKLFYHFNNSTNTCQFCAGGFFLNLKHFHVFDFQLDLLWEFSSSMRLCVSYLSDYVPSFCPEKNII